MSIYVEILMRASMDELWAKTQEPQLHEQWDVRFTCIEYLAQENSELPQKFLYATRIGFGLEIQGEGETKGSLDPVTGKRTSALRFWSDDAKSLIKEGSGYWKYQPTPDGIRFFTLYDYNTRFGWVGRAFDRAIFRPLMGWATAWSFDRLRLWLEEGVQPAVALRQSLVYAVTRLTIAFIWLWHGLVPKLIFQHADEMRMLTDTGISYEQAVNMVRAAGCLEVLMALLFLLAWQWRSLFVLNIVLMVAALVGVAVGSPQFLVAAFNPVTLNVSMIALSIIGLLSGKNLPSASRCLRKAPAGGR